MIDGGASATRHKLFMTANFILCFSGAALFLYFAVAIEKAGSSAEKLLNQWREYDVWIVGGLAALCVMICIPFILRTKR
jgi:membrane protein DedA with SNARE-associated domain